MLVYTERAKLIVLLGVFHMLITRPHYIIMPPRMFVCLSVCLHLHLSFINK